MSYGHRFTEEQLAWMQKNLDVGVFKNQKHFTDVFNALFDTHITTQSMNAALYRRGWRVKTYYNTNHWTDEMDDWLKQEYPKCNCDFVSLAQKFKNRFCVDKSASCITKHLERIGVHKPRKKQRNKREYSGDLSPLNRGTFKKGHTRTQQLPIGTIRYNSDGRPFIKVLESNGDSGQLSKYSGHNYKEPWWKPLQKKIWEDNYGEVPNGYVVCSLNSNPEDTDINNIGIIDKRGTAVMAKQGWWSSNTNLTKTAIQWCNLYYTLKDSE